MSIAHLAIGSHDVQATAEYLAGAMRWSLIPTPSNALRELAWLDLSPQRDRTQQIHIIHVPDHRCSAFEQEFGRHLAVFHDGDDWNDVQERVVRQGGTLIAPQRPTPFARFFFREPVNGYVWEVIHRQQWWREHDQRTGAEWTAPPSEP